MKIAKNDILTLQKGIPATFIMEDWESCNSAKSYAYQLKNSRDLPEGIEGYSVFVKSHDYKGETLWTTTILPY